MHVSATPRETEKMFQNLQNGFENTTKSLSHSINEIPTMPSATLDKLPRLWVVKGWMSHKIGKKNIFFLYTANPMWQYTQMTP